MNVEIVMRPGNQPLQDTLPGNRRVRRGVILLLGRLSPGVHGVAFSGSLRIQRKQDVYWLLRHHRTVTAHPPELEGG